MKIIKWIQINKIPNNCEPKTIDSLQVKAMEYILFEMPKKVLGLMIRI
jgi:hypothetical protein